MRASGGQRNESGRGMDKEVMMMAVACDGGGDEGGSGGVRRRHVALVASTSRGREG